MTGSPRSSATPVWKPASVEVVRETGSRVTVRDNINPAVRQVNDVFALIKDDGMPEDVKARVAPGLFQHGPGIGCEASLLHQQRWPADRDGSRRQVVVGEEDEPAGAGRARGRLRRPDGLARTAKPAGRSACLANRQRGHTRQRGSGVHSRRTRPGTNGRRSAGAAVSAAELLGQARRILNAPCTGGLSARLAAFLARQALEEIVDGRCADLGAPAPAANARSKLLVLRSLDIAEAADAAAVAWNRLSNACQRARL